mmetsp:Transcript_28365/g.51571  ORF Transcript_28365/g.51571 Transcript_28365/m.51571 type:complete len:218 (+) Transcript_28365:699-1352(+)
MLSAMSQNSSPMQLSALESWRIDWTPQHTTGPEQEWLDICPCETLYRRSLVHSSTPQTSMLSQVEVHSLMPHRMKPIFVQGQRPIDVALSPTRHQQSPTLLLSLLTPDKHSAAVSASSSALTAPQHERRRLPLEPRTRLAQHWASSGFRSLVQRAAFRAEQIGNHSRYSADSLAPADAWVLPPAFPSGTLNGLPEGYEVLMSLPWATLDCGSSATAH